MVWFYKWDEGKGNLNFLYVFDRNKYIVMVIVNSVLKLKISYKIVFIDKDIL